MTKEKTIRFFSKAILAIIKTAKKFCLYFKSTPLSRNLTLLANSPILKSVKHKLLKYAKKIKHFTIFFVINSLSLFKKVIIKLQLSHTLSHLKNISIAKLKIFATFLRLHKKQVAFIIISTLLVIITGILIYSSHKTSPCNSQIG